MLLTEVKTNDRTQFGEDEDADLIETDPIEYNMNNKDKEKEHSQSRTLDGGGLISGTVSPYHWSPKKRKQKVEPTPRPRLIDRMQKEQSCYVKILQKLGNCFRKDGVIDFLLCFSFVVLKKKFFFFAQKYIIHFIF